MQTDQRYRETKMRLLHKFTGIDFLRTAYSDKEEENRDWFKGAYRYESAHQILRSFMAGVPVS